LIRAYLANPDRRVVKALSVDRAAGETAQHGQLAHMGERVGNWPLEELLGRGVKRLIRGEKCIERGCVACQRSWPIAALRAQSKRSPM